MAYAESASAVSGVPLKSTLLVEDVMPGRRLLRYLAVMVAGAGLACGSYADLAGPPQKKVNAASPVRASFSRYILISGVWTCIEECDRSEPGGEPEQKQESQLPVQDSLPGNILPFNFP